MGVSKAFRAVCGESRFPIIGALTVWLVTLGVAPAFSKDDPDNLLDYAFANWVGTGVYVFSGLSLTILNMPFSVRADPIKNDRLGLKILLPVTIGSHKFSNLGNIEAVSFVPGAELEVPVWRRWLLKPFGQVGFGKDFSGGELSLIAGGGISSLVTFPWRRFTFGLGNKLLFAGSTTARGNNSRGFSRFDVGLNAHHPLNFQIRKRRATVSFFYVYSSYINDIDLRRFERADVKINRLHQLGFTLGTKPAQRIWRFRIPRFGLSYVTGNGLRGIRLNGGFPF